MKVSFTGWVNATRNKWEIAYRHTHSFAEVGSWASPCYRCGIGWSYCRIMPRPCGSYTDDEAHRAYMALCDTK